MLVLGASISNVGERHPSGSIAPTIGVIRGEVVNAGERVGVRGTS